MSQPSSSPQFRALAYLAVFLLGGGVAWVAKDTLTSSPPVAQTNTAESNSGAIVSTANTETPPDPTPTPPETAAPLTPTNFVTDVVNRVGPAVVRIDAERTVTSPQGLTPFEDPFFRQFFGVPQMPQERVQRGSGSGFVLNADGHIVTNAHVVEGADTVTVTLKDGRSFDGRVIGSDPITDVAVVKIDADNLPTLKFADSDNLQPGEWAIAIGNPLGLDNTVTTGIISATGRSSSEIGVPDKRVEFIQTDAAINPGNSGGPLLNQNGEAIGMNTAIIQNAQGLGFAIPANTVSRIAEELIATGRVRHPYLGIQMVTLTPEIKNNLNRNPNSGLTVEEDEGILIVRVMANSPAAEAGLRAGDVLLSIDGKTVTTADEVQQAVADVDVGQTLRLELKRNGETLTLEVRTGALNDAQR
ncbi:HhoA/HhoB/HtrA family serine endopeptidase [Baaleninema sp.]|uniref:HhoA/HhoB/HtrA family serine endopeptidase n=1 Tax=Baaleninema sp. TaxID=3101197 RepID=UPI003CFCBA41